MKRIRHAVILAGGEGARMAPFHLARPKCLLPVRLEPLLLRMFVQLSELGVDHFIVVASSKFQDLIQGAVRPWSATVVTAPSNHSQSAAVVGVQAVPPGEDYFLIEGDVWCAKEDLAEVAQALDGSVAIASLVDRLGPERPNDWLVADVQAGGIRAVWGHPRAGSWRLSGVSAMAGRLDRHFDVDRIGVQGEVGAMPPGQWEWAEALNHWLGAGNKVAAVEARQPLVNLDKPWHLYEANRLALESWMQDRPSDAEDWRGAGGGWVQAEADAEVSDTAVIRGPVHLGVGSSIGHGAIVEGPVWVGNDCRIEDYAKVSHSVVGHRSRISHTAEMLGGVLFDNVYLMHNCEVYGILGENVDIGAGTVFGTLRFDDGPTAHRMGGRWEVPIDGSNAGYLGDFVRTGVNAVILPGLHRDPYSVVGPGVVVDRDVEPFSQVLVHQEWAIKAWGPSRYGW
ncbi:MAG: NTP transferase domain-containing protein [Firmicutes bacterium]|nr:NTP transferase domain-containing protein [Bacillota bacterium]